MPYVITLNGKVYGPDGIIPIPDSQVEAQNRETERMEIEWLHTHPDRCTLYIQEESGEHGETVYRLTNCLGTALDIRPHVGRRSYVGFGGAYRRSVSCRIFGVLYHGWYMESSGDYCHLRKARRQSI